MDTVLLEKLVLIANKIMQKFSYVHGITITY